MAGDAQIEGSVRDLEQAWKFRLPRRRGHRILIAGCIAISVAVIPAVVIANEHSEDRSRDVARAIDRGHARNVILLVGDGLGDSEITIARNYQVGAAGRLALDRLPLTGAMTTHSVDENDPAEPVYVTESSASATAIATGTKTSNNRVSTSPGTDQDVPTILEAAKAAGLRTGNVTTAALTDATPAALHAHVSNRNCQGPSDMARCPADKKSAGGPGSIAEQAVEHGTDVLLGGGSARFDQTIPAGEGPYAGQTVRQQAVALGYDVVTDAAGMGAATSSRKVLGLFASGDMAVEMTGDVATEFPGSGPQTCAPNTSRPATEPGLAAMTSKALGLLTTKRRRDGFFLQVEGASIDKQAHSVDPCGQIGETIAFDRAVRVALDYAATNRDTLVIVTGDHGSAAQIISTEALGPPGQAPGLISNLITHDGATMTVSYATNNTPVVAGPPPPFPLQDHSGTQIRVAARGPQAANVVGVIDNTELFDIMERALRLE